jgi:hypothetical protein
VRVLTALVLGLIALAFVWTWAYGNTYSDDACLNARAPEMSSYHAEASLWPPGGRCVIELASGDERVVDGPVPWFEWTFLALCAAGVLAAASLWRRLGRAVHSRARPE